MKHYLEQASMLLDTCPLNYMGIVQARTLLHGMVHDLKKQGAIGDLVNSPTFQNILNVLAPYITNYNVRQAVGLLQKLNEEILMSSSPLTRPIRRI